MLKWTKRIFLFILTNLMVMTTISVLVNVLSAVFGISLQGPNLSGLVLFCGVWGMAGALISLLMSKFTAKMFMGVQLINSETPEARARQLVQTVHTLAQRAGLKKMPEVGIYESPEVNAFATGPSRNNALVALSTGLLDTMTEAEVEGVIGHEIAHIANGDMVTLTLIQGVVNAFVLFFARIIGSLVAQTVDEKFSHIVYFLTVTVLDICFTLLGSMVVAYFSRQREFRADAGGAQYAGVDKMLAGLRRLQARYESPAALEAEDRAAASDGALAPAATSPALAALKISSRPGGFLALISTHPPLAERIARLERLN